MSGPRSRRHRAAGPDAYRERMLAVADRLCSEFPHLSLIAVVRAMSEVRRYADDPNPDPATVHRLARALLTEAAVH